MSTSGMNRSRINFPLLLIVVAVALGLFGVGWQRITIDTDIVSSLPHKDPVIDNALHIFRNHPMQDQITIDVGINIDAPDRLVECGRAVAAQLEQSGLFKSVGMADIQGQLPQLIDQLIDNLPVLFSEKALQRSIEPLLTPHHIDNAVQRWRSELLQMNAIGQSTFIGRDPLGFKDILLGKLTHLAPSSKAHFYKGELISDDGRHLLVTAVPATSSTDTAFARELSDSIDGIAEKIHTRFATQGINVTLTAVGAYRAALDNEVLIRGDVRNALLFATLGIALLLLMAFPRPLIGVLSLLPAIAGILCAFFIWSLVYRSISIMVLGFGGAIISITVDHGIAYLLFLDRPQKTFGKAASREVWAVGLLATLTTVGAFAALTLSDFDIFRQLGQFAALGIGLSFLFVHAIFPRIFPALEGSRPRALPLPKVADRLFGFGRKGLWAALIFFIIMALFARPDFSADASAMNTMSKASMAAENQLMATWGDIFSKVFLLTEADSMADLQRKSDRLLKKMESDRHADLLEQAFLPAMFFPGLERQHANLEAWKSFWHPERVTALQQELQNAALQHGFTEDAFTPFLEMVQKPENHIRPEGIPEAFFSFLGIAKGPSQNAYRQFASLTLPVGYSPESFFDHYSSSAAIFEPALFSHRLGALMFHTFSRLIMIIAPAVAILLFLFFLDLGLTLIALAPLVFAMVCTLGTLHLMGRPLDIPALMLAIIVLGMGIDYALFIVRSYQRYGREADPSFSLFRSAVVMTSTSTLIGFGVLVFARHSLLQSAGISSALGIGYSAIGAFLILPPLLKWRLEREPRRESTAKDLRSRILHRYRVMEPYIRFFARFKLKLDPMFRELPYLLRFPSPPLLLIDVGSGYGVPACWLAESFPSANIYGIEPDPHRVRVANRALKGQGTIACGLAPDLPLTPAAADAAFMLDMIHFLDADDLKLVLKRLNQALITDAPLIVRAVMVPNRRWTWLWWLEGIKLKLSGSKSYYRSTDEINNALALAGFSLEATPPSGRDEDTRWFKARKTASIAD